MVQSQTANGAKMSFSAINKQMLSRLVALEKAGTYGMESRQRYFEMHQAPFHGHSAHVPKIHS
jgi:hypothetical protein